MPKIANEAILHARITSHRPSTCEGALGFRAARATWSIQELGGFMKRAMYLAATVATAVVAWSVPELAMAGPGSVPGATASQYAEWEGVEITDTACDNNDVYSDWKRDRGTPQVLRNSQGCGVKEQSGRNRQNLVQRYNACVDDAGPNTCSDPVRR